MKKTLLLSVVASTMIMAGGDIAPVEPAVETPAPAVSGWEFSGQAALYYQTKDNWGRDSLFDQEASTMNANTSAADAGIQLRAVNADLYNGIGAGAEVSGLATFDLEKSVVSDVMQAVSDDLDGGWISQMYLTYGFDNTSFKLGRQELPKALSPFAYSEEWNVFKNTYDAALVVNSDITNTTLVGAWVRSANQNGYGLTGSTNYGSSQPMSFHNGVSDMSSFEEINGDHGVFMLTAQNKSIENLTLTGSWYYSNEFLTNDDLNILWGDAQYNFMENYNVALQGGTVMHDTFDDDTTAFGAMVGGKFGMFNASLAFSTVNDGGFGVFNVGGVKTPLYTQMLLNENAIRLDSDSFVAKADADALGGNICLAYGYSDLGNAAMRSTFSTGSWSPSSFAGSGTYQELDLAYTAEITESATVTAAYIYQNDDRRDYSTPVSGPSEDQNVIRVIGRYNF